MLGGEDGVGVEVGLLAASGEFDESGVGVVHAVELKEADEEAIDVAEDIAELPDILDVEFLDDTDGPGRREGGIPEEVVPEQLFYGKQP